jgi:hypothetical protein
VTKSNEESRTILIKDPDLPWPNEFPYDRLSKSLREKGHAGLDSSSPLQQIKDSLWELMGHGPVDRESREAWDNLRKVESRLPIDFLMYSLECGDGDLASEALWELPMPLLMPDFCDLADGEPAYENMMSLPESFPETPLPGAAALELDMFLVDPVNIGPATVDAFEILGDD